MTTKACTAWLQKWCARATVALLLGVVFQSYEHTLRDEEVQAWSQQVIAALEALGGKLRS